MCIYPAPYGPIAMFHTTRPPSFLLLGIDCRTPTEAALLPPQELEPTEISDYREEVILSPSTARRLAAEAIKGAQTRYKRTYDQRSKEVNYQLGDWVMVKFPQEETGRLCKLSRPWHGPYHIIDRQDPDVTVVKIYAPQDGQIQVHQTRVAPCPPQLPAGFYWYGTRRSSPGRPPKWVDQWLRGEQFPQRHQATGPEDPFPRTADEDNSSHSSEDIVSTTEDSSHPQRGTMTHDWRLSVHSPERCLSFQLLVLDPPVSPLAQGRRLPISVYSQAFCHSSMQTRDQLKYCWIHNQRVLHYVTARPKETRISTNRQRTGDTLCGRKGNIRPGS